MKRMTFSLSAALLLLLLPSRGSGVDRDAKADLVPAGDSGVSGFVQLTQLPRGGTVVYLIGSGFEPGAVYTSFWHGGADCTGPAERLVTFAANAVGVAEARGRLDRDVADVGSVSVQLGAKGGELKACARVR